MTDGGTAVVGAGTGVVLEDASGSHFEVCGCCVVEWSWDFDLKKKRSEARRGESRSSGAELDWAIFRIYN